jgi:hypothetical protein
MWWGVLCELTKVGGRCRHAGSNAEWGRTSEQLRVTVTSSLPRHADASDKIGALGYRDGPRRMYMGIKNRWIRDEWVEPIGAIRRVYKH